MIPISDDGDDSQDGPSEEQFRDLTEKLDIITDEAENIGLYVESGGVIRVPTHSGAEFGVFAEFTIGRVALTKRIQNSEQDRIDKAFGELTLGMDSDYFLEARERFKKNREAGGTGFDVGSGNETD